MLTKLDDVILYYRVEGSGPTPVLFLHGWGRDANYWNSFLQEFSNINKNWRECFTCYLVDLPGFGLSSAPSAVWGAEDYAAFLCKWLRTVSSTPLERWVFVGHSFGGKVSMFLSRKASPSGVALLAASGVRKKTNLRQQLKLKCRQGLFKLAKAFIKLWYRFDPNKIEEALEHYRQRHGSSDYRAAKGVMRNILVRTITEDVTPWLAELKKLAMLLIWGEQDTEVPISSARIIAQLTGAPLKILENTGHDLLQDNLAATTQWLGEFLQTFASSKVRQ